MNTKLYERSSKNFPELVVFGDAAMDVCIRAADVPEKGEDVPVESITYVPGGSAANCAVVAARLGVQTFFIGNVGNDDFAKVISQDLVSMGVDTRYVSKLEGDTGTVTSILTPDHERTFFSYRGVNSREHPGTIPTQLFHGSTCLHLTGYSFQDPGSKATAQKLIQMARQADARISLDPSFCFIQEMVVSGEELLADIDLFFPNQVEAGLLAGTQDPEKAARAILQMGPQQVILKMGADGCLLVNHDESTFIPGFAVSKVVDTTGAGDAFCGGFLTGHLLDLTARESAVIGNLAAAGVVEVVGGHSGAIDLRELYPRLTFNQQADLSKKISIASNRLHEENI